MKNVVKENISVKEVSDYIIDHPNSKIFFGCDSQKISKKNKKNKNTKNTKNTKRTRYITVVVCYEKDCSKIFAEISFEEDYDSNPGRPTLRLMNEVYKVSEIISRFNSVLDDREWSCHLDISPKPENGSNCVFQQAVGYIKGMHGIDPVVKPDAWCSSTIADHIVKHGDIKSLCF